MTLSSLTLTYHRFYWAYHPHFLSLFTILFLATCLDFFTSLFDLPDSIHFWYIYSESMTETNCPSAISMVFRFFCGLDSQAEAVVCPGDIWQQQMLLQWVSTEGQGLLSVSPRRAHIMHKTALHIKELFDKKMLIVLRLGCRQKVYTLSSAKSLLQSGLTHFSVHILSPFPSSCLPTQSPLTVDCSFCWLSPFLFPLFFFFYHFHLL